jgi:hypothetical protein
MIGFPKYFNSKQDYINMVQAWPSEYAECGTRAQMIAALDLLLSTATMQRAIWPEGFDPLNPGTEPVQPIGWETVTDPNGSIFRLGCDVDQVTKLKGLVEELDPLIEQAETWVTATSLPDVSSAMDDVALSLTDLSFMENNVIDSLGAAKSDLDQAISDESSIMPVARINQFLEDIIGLRNLIIGGMI